VFVVGVVNTGIINTSAILGFVGCANLHATNQLNINSKNLAVSSVQNKHKAKTRSQGANAMSNPIELDLLLLVVLRLLAPRLLVVRL
jgi:hypothetical protein